MSGDHVLPVIHKDWNIKAERLNTLSDLEYLLVAMDSRVLWVGFKRRCREVDHLQS